MSNDNSIQLPRIPGTDFDPGSISLPDKDRVIPDTSYLKELPTDIDYSTLVKSPIILPEVIARYQANGESGILAIEQRIRSNARKKEGGRFAKGSVHYTPQSPFPPVVWEYKCHTCRFYTPPDESPTGNPQCEVVGRGDNLLGGADIHPDAWCALWLPEDGKEWFEYVTDRLEGTS
jgi:hypothetical protein